MSGGLARMGQGAVAVALVLMTGWGSVAWGGQLEDLSWLLGEWRHVKVASGEAEAAAPSSVTIERWQRVSSSTFEGSSERRRSGELQFAESLRLVEMKSEVFYLAKVDENALPIAFRLTRLEGTDATFENPGHDFPQRLRYRLDAGRLSVRVEADNPEGGPPRGFDVTYQAVTDPVPPASFGSRE